MHMIITKISMRKDLPGVHTAFKCSYAIDI